MNNKKIFLKEVNSDIVEMQKKKKKLKYKQKSWGHDSRGRAPA
jgi:hypothetical protein